jgi:WhiB family transcriptional regulator, redox-sensing transcriptional regulator
MASREMELLRSEAPAHLVDWDLQAACRGVDTEKFYGTSEAAVARAKGICGRCFVQTVCLTVADEMERGLGPRMVHGIWGGLTPDERIERRRAGPIVGTN